LTDQNFTYRSHIIPLAYQPAFPTLPQFDYDALHGDLAAPPEVSRNDLSGRGSVHALTVPHSKFGNPSDAASTGGKKANSVFMLVPNKKRATGQTPIARL
jgi:hypothetical protein